MTRPRFDPGLFRSVLLGAFTVFLFPACRTENVTLPEGVVSTSPASPSQGGLLVIVAPAAATAAEEQANETETTYHVLVDGQVQLDGQVFDVPDPPIVTQPGFASLGGYYDPGVHHIELAATDSATVFAVDGMITSGAVTRLYVFGPRGGLQARFDAYPLQPPANQYHVSAINLVRAGGVQIEVVSCTDAQTCTAVSPPLSLGDTFDSDISNISFNPASTTFSASGAGYGYRQVATASLLTPPVLPLAVAVVPSGCIRQPDGTYVCPGQPISGFVAAPIYMSGDGNMILQSD